MHVLVDLDNLRLLAKHDSHIALSALAYIQFANADTQIVRLGENKNWSCFDTKQMRGFAASLGVALPDGAQYGAIIKLVRATVEATDWLVLPFTAEALYRQAAQIPPTSNKPFAFNPNGDEPEKLLKWHAPPNRDRSRHECQHWINFTNAEPPGILAVGQNSAAPWNARSGDGTIPSRTPRQAHSPENTIMAAKKAAAPATPAAPKKKATPPAQPVAKAAKAKAEKAVKEPKAPKVKAEKAPKAERIEANGVKRPKAGTTGDKIWSTADTLSAKKKSPASFDEVSKSLGDTVNEASMRAGYQRWRKFNGLKGRLAAAE